jgi:hypothetical protein
MKIVITLVVEMDPKDWEQGGTPSEVRDDVKTYVHSSVQQSPQLVDVADVTIR